VDVGRAAVGRPARVADTGRAVAERRVGERVAQGAELAGLLAHPQASVIVDDRDAGGVVAAILEAGEAGDKDVLAGARAHVSDDSTHVVKNKRGFLRGIRTNPDAATPASQLAQQHALHAVIDALVEYE